MKRRMHSNSNRIEDMYVHTSMLPAQRSAALVQQHIISGTHRAVFNCEKKIYKYI